MGKHFYCLSLFFPTIMLNKRVESLKVNAIEPMIESFQTFYIY